jgi:hypothetical protein
VSWDKTQQVAKAIRSSFGFSSYTALRHMHQRCAQAGGQKSLTTMKGLATIILTILYGQLMACVCNGTETVKE